MSKRNEWTFQHSALRLAVACKAKVDRHEARIKFWKAEKEKAEAKYDKATVTIKKYQITGGERREAVIDPTLQQRLNECSQRLQFHEGKRDEYKSWQRTFDTAGTAALHLQHDDVVFFGLAETEKDIAQ